MAIAIEDANAKLADVVVDVEAGVGENSFATLSSQIGLVWSQLGISLFIATYSYFDKSVQLSGPLCFRRCFEKETKKSLLIQRPPKTTHSIVVVSMVDTSEIFLPISCNTFVVVCKVSIYAV